MVEWLRPLVKMAAAVEMKICVIDGIIVRGGYVRMREAPTYQIIIHLHIAVIGRDGTLTVVCNGPISLDAI